MFPDELTLKTNVLSFRGNSFHKSSIYCRLTYRYSPVYDIGIENQKWEIGSPAA